ncbi:hypothetical protein F5B22DRAFT_637411 [Xylaria bambusicola]|uniref:uncharacterized protein n=1 Tax=Xylaria bambusicola TaxID=326684 RepID=UPI0020078223|nr:uncharacterized protein F5B22DRAFT_637411 [Xylaria bambusicola]KAI0513040.1 hypothetical protein F5B22DRAFT_637411 [Xylaria bambusicola]
MATRTPYSLGCHACRRMKVKCDEKKPQCGRCAKARRLCPGYPDTKQVIFRSVNEGLASKGKAARPLRTRTHNTSAASDHAGDLASDSCIPQLLAQPSEAWDTRAISHFLYHYTSSATKDSSGYLGFLSDLLSNSPSVPYLKSAVLAAGSASLANITGLVYLQITAEKHYGETLRCISSALKNPLEASSDATLVAIIILQMYEVIVGITRVSCDPHQKGLVELSRIRGNARLGTRNDNALLQVIHGRVHTNAIGGLCPSPINMDYDVKRVDIALHEAELWRLMRKTSQCCVATWTMISVPSYEISSNEVIKSIDNLYSTYHGLLNWRKTLPSIWSYQSCEMPSRDAQPGTIYPEKYHLFKNIHHGAMWISFWCTVVYALQVLVHASSLPILEQCLNQDQYSIQDLQRRLYSAVDDICACVPYMLGDVDRLGLPVVGKDGKALGAYFLLRGLYVASCVEELTDLQREYMMTTFLRIAHGKGIKLALRPRNRWLNRQQRDEMVR